MKLLLDENLSRRIVPFLQQNYPDSSQVVLLGLQAATDAEIWEFAKTQGYVVVSRDADFSDLSVLKGAPPKLIRLRTPNLSRVSTLNLLLSSQMLVEQVLIQENEAYVEIVNAM
jgi:predicted nuclease of predicted toxin-antitoxin system